MVQSTVRSSHVMVGATLTLLIAVVPVVVAVVAPWAAPTASADAAPSQAVAHHATVAVVGWVGASLVLAVAAGTALTAVARRRTR